MAGLDLNGILEDGVTLAFTVLGNKVKTATFKDATGGTYNRSTGAVTEAYDEVSVRAVLVDYRQKERTLDTEIGPKDRKLVIEAVGTAKSLNIEDKIDVDGVSWRVKQVSVPTPEVWIVRVQPIS